MLGAEEAVGKGARGLKTVLWGTEAFFLCFLLSNF